MCLSKLEDFAVTQSHGWQTFIKSSEGLYSRFFGNGTVPVGEWQKDKFRIFNRWICTDNFEKYKKGFHIFLDEEDAKTFCHGIGSYCVKKVRFKKVVARGFQKINTISTPQLTKVVVCRKRFVEPDSTKDIGGRSTK